MDFWHIEKPPCELDFQNCVFKIISSPVVDNGPVQMGVFLLGCSSWNALLILSAVMMCDLSQEIGSASKVMPALAWKSHFYLHSEAESQPCSLPGSTFNKKSLNWKKKQRQDCAELGCF